MGRGPDDDGLALLNAAEREVLDLLARGHTAKSIANLTGRSVGAVNERLREARRKTGVASSRELARLYAAQENRDELIGVSAATPLPAEPGSPAPRRTQARRLLMIATPAAALLLAASIFYSTRPADDQAVPPTPPALPTAAGAWDGAARQWHDRFAIDPVDSRWAPTAENALRARFASIPDLDTGDDPLAIACHAHLCEVTATATGDDPTLSRLVDRVQGIDHVRVDDADLTVVSFAVRTDHATPGTARFLVHFQRK